MAKDEWAALEINLSQYKTLEDTTNMAINEIGIQQSYTQAGDVITVSSDIVYIRAIIII